MTTQQQQQMGYDILRACDQYPMDRDHIFDLIDQGADLNVQNKEGYTVLMRFIQRWDNPLLIRALDAGADPYIRNNHNETALIVACHIGARWCLETLLEKAPHFDFDVQSTFGEKRTALHATLFAT